jgi:hypothetical protein
MAADSPDTEARIAELKNAPVPVKWIACASAVLGLLVWLGFLASAFAGHIGWGRAFVTGLLQFLFIWLAGIAVQDRKVLGWWVSLMFALMRLWWGLGHGLRLVRVTLEGKLPDHGRELWADIIGALGLLASATMLVLLMHKAVRAHVHWPNGKPA